MVSTPKSKGKINHPVRRRTLVVKKAKKNMDLTVADLDVSAEIDSQVVATSEDVVLPQRPYVANAVKHFLTKVNHQSQSTKQELFEDDKVIFLQLAIGKIPKCPIKTLNFSLTHSILPADHDILLITPDLKSEKKNDYEKNVEHYRAFLEKSGVQGVKEILPFHKLREEYQEFEMQSRLMGLYDMIISDASVFTYVNKTIGSMIHKRKKLHTSIKVHVTNLKPVFEKALQHSQLTIHGNGDNFSMQIGHLGMEESHLVDNIIAASEELDKKLPGGFVYVKSLHLRTARSKAIQFYVSQLNFSPLKRPVAKANKPKLSLPVKGELSTEMDAQVTVMAGGDVIVSKNENGDAAGDGSKPKRARKEPERLQMPKRSVPVKTGKKKGKVATENKENQVGPKKKRGGGKKKATDVPLTEKAAENKKSKKAGKKDTLSNDESEVKQPKAKVAKEPKEPKAKKEIVKNDEPKAAKPVKAKKATAEVPEIATKVKKQIKKEESTGEVTPAAKEKKVKETKKEKEVKPKAPKKEPKKAKEASAEQTSPNKKTSPKRKLEEGDEGEQEVVVKKKGKKAGKKDAAAN